MAASRTEGFSAQIAANADVLLALGVFGTLAILLVPVPALLLDLLLTVSIAASVLLFLAALYVKKPTELSAFPVLLLVTTVLRLALNVASTRRILIHGADGPAAAGQVVEAFGQFVVGGDPIVGLVVFIILIVINFVVITKGAGRVAEVAARFTLDAMPGKQMAVDAELNAGLIDEATARKRRRAIAQEADFYGAMDGASKFIRGDAMAGMLITAVNALGGVLIGVLQHGMSLRGAIDVYTILTIGDGLVGQVPALVVSIAAALLVTRVTDTDDTALHEQLRGQLLRSPRVLGILAGLLGLFAVIPGLRIPFALVAVVAGAAAFAWRAPEAESKPIAPDEPPQAKREPGPDDVLRVDPLVLEVGLDLLYLVDEKRAAELVGRIQRTRTQFAQDLGVVLPKVHVRDNGSLGGGEYAILLRGEEIARGAVHAHQNLALDPGSTTGQLRGIPVRDPVFGLPAHWIPEAQVLKAQSLGYTVVDVATVITTHFVELMHVHAHELYDGAQLGKALERVAADSPKLVEDLTPDPLSRPTLLRVFRNLVREGIPVRDPQLVLEALSDYAGKSKEPDVLTEFVRQRMARTITRRFSQPDGVVHYVGFAPDAEDALLRGLQNGEGGPVLHLDPETARKVFAKVKEITQGWNGDGTPVVLCPPLARGALRRMLERALPRVPVVSSAELVPAIKLDRIGVVELRAPNPQGGLK